MRCRQHLHGAWAWLACGMETVFIGESSQWGGYREERLSIPDRRHHIAIFGQTGVGKSTLLKSLILQDIRAGRGCAILDPHGDLATELLDYIPRHRIDDVVFFDPANRAFAPGLNLLSAVAPDERYRVAEDIVAVFGAIWGLSTETTPRLLYILINTVAALMDVPNGATLLGVPRMLVDTGYRRWVVRHTRNPTVRRFWQMEFEEWPERMRLEATAAVLNKAELLISSPVLHNVLGQVKPTIRAEDVLENGKIFIANLSKGLLGETSAQLFGALLVTSFDLAARKRAGIPEEDRRDFALYADEFQNFATDRFASLLSEARKYRFSRTLATQYTAQLPEAIRAAIFGNVGTLISFRVGDDDATVLSRTFHPWPPAVLRDLGRGEVVLRRLEDGLTRDPVLARTRQDAWPRVDRSDNIRRQSNRRYTKPRSVVEHKLFSWLGFVGD